MEETKEKVKMSPEEKKLHDMYEKLINYENEVHERNQKKIKIGIRCIWTIPLVFLLLLFFTNSSKIIFLVLWIVSLFGIAVFLISVEYNDYMIQEKLHEINGDESAEINGLIDLDEVGERVMARAMQAEKIIEAREEELKL